MYCKYCGKKLEDGYWKIIDINNRVIVENMYGIEELKERIAALGKENQKERMLVRDLVKAEDLVVLVTPIDSSAPKGRLILPQQQTIRDLLEADAIPVVTKENTLKTTLESLGKKPAMVITDSQAFAQVSKDTPLDIPLTSFSILCLLYTSPSPRD